MNIDKLNEFDVSIGFRFAEAHEQTAECSDGGTASVLSSFMRLTIMGRKFKEGGTGNERKGKTGSRKSEVNKDVCKSICSRRFRDNRIGDGSDFPVCLF